MKLDEHLECLENKYDENIEEAYEKVSFSSTLLIKNMEIFLKDYHSYNSCVKQLDDLVEKREKLQPNSENT